MKVGIDLSLCSPAVVTMVDNRVTANFFPQRKREKGLAFSEKCSWKGQELVFSCRAFERPLDSKMELAARYDVIAQSIIEAINNNLPTGSKPQITMEAYAYDAVSSSASSIHELGGVLKYEMYKRGWTWVEVAPTSVKKQFTGSGKSKKDGMRRAFVEGGMPSLDEKFGLDPDKCANPVQDIVDAFAVTLCESNLPDLKKKQNKRKRSERDDF